MNQQQSKSAFFYLKFYIVIYGIMTIYKCKFCNYETERKNDYDKHMKTDKHKTHNMISPIYLCKKCEYSTLKKSDFDRHLTTKKHIGNKPDNSIEQQDINYTLQKLINKMNIIDKKNDQNVNKIVKEARIIKYSILTILNNNFKNTPSIEYIKQTPFIIELEKEYNARINDNTDKIFMLIFQDYEKKKLTKTLSDIILRFVKKDDQTLQSVFNIDCARSNFATKINDFWLNDKKGLQLRKYTINKVIFYMIDVLEIFRLQLVEIRNENLKNPTHESSEYLMKYQALLLEVVSFLNHPSTHSKIITQLSPNLRCDEQLLLCE